jgi:nucleotide-binding universal stress UspA family protein
MSPDGWTILVGIDGSERADEALAFARGLCDAVGGRLVLGAVYAYRSFGGRLESGDAARALVTSRQRAGGRGGSARIAPGRTPAEGLLAIAEAERANVIVLGSRHRGRLGEALPGAVTRDLLQDGRFAIAVVPGAHRPSTLEHVGVVGDATEAGRAAMLVAGLVASDSGAALHVQGLDSSRRAAAPEWRAAEDLARGALDLLVVAARPHNLLGRLRRVRPNTDGASPVTCPLMVVPAAARLPIMEGPSSLASA